MSKIENRRGTQEPQMFADLLEERRITSDIAWSVRQMNPVIAHKLPPPLNYSTDQVIKAVLINPRVVSLIKALASARKVPVAVVRNEAHAMLVEMAGTPHLPTIRVLGIVVTKGLKRMLKSIRINQSFLLDLKGKMEADGVQHVYVPTHRSYLDFILLSYLLFSSEMAIPNIASGMDFYQMKVIGELLRRSGAFYMRRTFATDQLYKEVFRAYINCIVAHSERAIEFFIEGTRSRSQKSLAPKYGLLAMILEGLWKGEVSDIRFVPLSINYDRPLEEMLFAYELLGVPKPPESTTGLFKSLSILNEPFAYGNAYIVLAPPISARQFLDPDMLRKSTLSPNHKLPSEAVKDLANAIISSHKSHTALSPFNLVALLFNERVHSHPREPYTLDTLVTDYSWIKEFLSNTMSALVHPGKVEHGRDVAEDCVKKEVLESLFTHRELVTFNANGELMLMERHRNSENCDPKKVKGHSLNQQTMRLAVPTINMTIYTNPSMAFLAKPAFVAVCIIESGCTKESVFTRYTLLRELLTTEFALVSEKSIAAAEWEEGLSILVGENCVQVENNFLVMGNNAKLFSLLQNLLLPYLAASYVTCTIINQWCDEMGELTESCILKNTQKQAELLLFGGHRILRNPYSLSLDLYASTLVSLLSMGIISISRRAPNAIYSSDKIRLDALITELDKFQILSPLGSYLDIVLLPGTEAAQAVSIPRAKL